MNEDLRRRIPPVIALGRVAFGLGLMATPAAGASVYLGAEAKTTERAVHEPRVRWS